jgi:ComF family protein
MSLSALLSQSLQLVWPAQCAACGCPVPDQVAFCGACALSVNPLVGVCPGCALPMHEDPRQLMFEGRRCGRCVRVPLPFATAAAALEYGEAAADGIIRMKHGGQRHLAAPLGVLLAPALADALAAARFEADDLIVPVPLHVRRLRARGFNQALELARHALAALGKAPGFRRAGGLPRLHRALLERTRATRELGRASPAARFAEVAGAFAVTDPACVEGRRVLLVDDVMTTGATFSACAGALLDAGASRVHVLALARAV